jgi:hypothetical protein
VALTTGSLSAASEHTLASDGWRVIHVPPLSNPGQGPQPGRGYPARFVYVYTKLYIFKMIEYKKSKPGARGDACAALTSRPAAIQPAALLVQTLATRELRAAARHWHTEVPRGPHVPCALLSCHTSRVPGRGHSRAEVAGRSLPLSGLLRGLKAQ